MRHRDEGIYRDYRALQSGRSVWSVLTRDREYVWVLSGASGRSRGQRSIVKRRDQLTYASELMAVAHVAT